MPAAGTGRRDVVVVGGGHNALTAAAYLARAGLSVLLLERDDHLGGATVSAEVFPGTGARLSRYSYLVSLLPQQVVDDLGLSIPLRRRRFASYTPRPGTDVGLLVDNLDAAATQRSFETVGAGRDLAGFTDLQERTARLARAVWPSVTGPLPRRSELRRALRDDATWDAFVERPLGEVIERSVRDDLVRGVVLTDGLISTFARAHQADLQQNVCFLYHVIGGGTGAWDVPVGGMGAVSGALESAARDAGATLVTGAEVTAVDGDGVVSYAEGDAQQQVRGTYVLWGAAPAHLARARGTEPPVAEGAQIKVNLLLSRLPRLRERDVAPEAAFGGTLHVNESYSQLDSAYAVAESGALPRPVPAEIYCHSLTDPTILSPRLREQGAQTLTVFTLQTPHRLIDHDRPDEQRAQWERAVLDSISSVLAEPLDDVVLRGPDGRPCVETRTTLDLERSPGMPGGSIFHGPLDWPFAEDDEPLDTPAARWGVATDDSRILLCGAGSRRGGGVSGLGGYHAAQAVLEDLRRARAGHAR